MDHLPGYSDVDLKQGLSYRWYIKKPYRVNISKLSVVNGQGPTAGPAQSRSPCDGLFGGVQLAGGQSGAGSLMSSQLARQLVAPLPPSPRPYVRTPRLYHALNTASHRLAFGDRSYSPARTNTTRHPHRLSTRDHDQIRLVPGF